MQISVVITVTGEMLGAAMCSAVEGGSTYWCSDILIPEEIADKYTHWYYDEKFWEEETCGFDVTDAEEGKIITVTRTAIAKGVKIMAEKYPDHFNDMVKMEGDANTGDVLLQCMTFGEVVYG
jgi:hypothetical protein